MALDRGYFSQEGLDVQLQSGLAGGAAIAGLLSGSLDLAAIALDASSINAVSRNVQMRIVSPLTYIPPEDKNAAIIVRQDLIDSGRYKGPQDFKGMVIGAGQAPNTSAQLFVELALAKGGLSASDVEFVQLGFPDMLAALASHKIDAAWEIEPLATSAEDRGIAREVMWAGELFPNYDPFLIVESPQFAQSQPEALKRFTAAQLRGQREYYAAFRQNQGGQAAKDAIIQSLTARTLVKDAAVWQELTDKGRMHSVDPNDAFHLQGFDVLQDYFVKAGTLDRKIDISNVIDPAPVEYALQRLGKE
jgi:NitT/TauT family transport system substrate-binding protein